MVNGCQVVGCLLSSCLLIVDCCFCLLFTIYSLLETKNLTTNN